VRSWGAFINLSIFRIKETPRHEVKHFTAVAGEDDHLGRDPGLGKSAPGVQRFGHAGLDEQPVLGKDPSHRLLQLRPGRN